MTEKQKLNVLLRLRLFFSTEKEYAAHTGYKLTGNHFNRIKTFQSEAYYSHFAKKCETDTMGHIDLDRLLEVYESTSHFFGLEVQGRAVLASEQSLREFVLHLYLGREASPKVEQLAAGVKEKNANVALLVLMAMRVLPVFSNKTWGDIPDIVADAERVYAFLESLAGKDAVCLRDFRMLIDNECHEPKGDWLSRLMLIYCTGEVLDLIFLPYNPEEMLRRVQMRATLHLDLPRFWQPEGPGHNINEVWLFVPTLNCEAWLATRCIINSGKHELRYVTYQLTFEDIGSPTVTHTIIMTPEFLYCNTLGVDIVPGSLSTDYTQIGYTRDFRDGKAVAAVSKLTFGKHCSLGDDGLTLKAVTDSKKVAYFERCLKSYTQVNEKQQYQIALELLSVAVCPQFLLFAYEGRVYRLNKLDADGRETIAGISSLRGGENYVMARLVHEGQMKLYLCLDSINANVELASLAGKPWFRELTAIGQLLEP